MHRYAAVYKEQRLEQRLEQRSLALNKRKSSRWIPDSPAFESSESERPIQRASCVSPSVIVSVGSPERRP